MNIKQIAIDLPWLIIIGYILYAFIKTMIGLLSKKHYAIVAERMQERMEEKPMLKPTIDSIGGLKSLIYMALLVEATCGSIILWLWIHFNH